LALRYYFYCENIKFNSLAKGVRDFKFKQFTISQEGSTHKVGTDGVLLGAWVNIDNAKTVLDIGTGSGVIALMLAQRTNVDVTIDAIEIQYEDATQAKKNVEASAWKDRTTIFQVAAQDFSTGKQYDLIVSNPPYFINSWLPPDKKRTMVRHTESLSFPDLLDAVKKLLKPSGRFGVILPDSEGGQFIHLARTFGLFCIRKCAFRTRDHKPVERLLLELAFSEVICETGELLLYAQGDEWSENYKMLTGDFYLKA
jgi:tRNA1Val (adenine37-N6)-methyltransferase